MSPGKDDQTKSQQEGESPEAGLARRAWEQIWPLAVAVVIALGIRAVIIESYYVPSGSMLPTLLVGDHVFVNKFVFGARIPFTEIQLPALRDPRRGEIVVFALGRRGPGAICPLDRCPDYPAEGFVKRIVGIPGDTIAMRDGKLVLNGVVLPSRDTGQTFEDYERQVYEVLEEDLDGCVHQILDNPMRAPRNLPTSRADLRTYTVPEGRYYFLGDNRDNSNDSRFWKPESTVRRMDLKGPVIVNYWSWNNTHSWAEMANPLVWFDLLLNHMRWGRIGTNYACRAEE